MQTPANKTKSTKIKTDDIIIDNDWPWVLPFVELANNDTETLDGEIVVNDNGAVGISVGNAVGLIEGVAVGRKLGL